MDWLEFLRGAGLIAQQNFIVWQPTAFTGRIGAGCIHATQDSWKDLLSYHLIEAYSAVLPKAIADERFAFFGTVLSGTTAQRPRWQRGVFVVNGLLGDEVGKIYAQRYFPPESKAAAEEMVTNIKAAFRKRIRTPVWMAATTKAEAEAKLATLYVGVGYPEVWHTYDGYEVQAG